MGPSTDTATDNRITSITKSARTDLTSFLRGRIARSPSLRKEKKLVNSKYHGRGEIHITTWYDQMHCTARPLMAACSPTSAVECGADALRAGRFRRKLSRRISLGAHAKPQYGPGMNYPLSSIPHTAMPPWGPSRATHRSISTDGRGTLPRLPRLSKRIAG